MRVGVEATSMLGARSGVGHTTAAVVEAMVAVDPHVEVVLLPVSVRGAGRLRRTAPTHERISCVRARIPARLATWAWTRGTWPPAELFCGEVDAFWGPNFLLPPLLKAAGVVTVHDLAFLHMPDACSAHVRTYAETVPVAARRANRIVVPSAFVGGEVAGWLPEEADRIRVVSPGVREAFRGPGGTLTPPRAGSLGLREPYVSFVGNLELRKNLDVLLDAFSAVHERRQRTQLVLIGSPGIGWDEIAVRHADLLDGDAVVVAGYLPDPEVAAIVRGSRAFVYPSTYEGFGMPPLEALATGTPVIAAKAASLPEALGGHATFVHPEAADELADAIEGAFVDDPDPAAIDAGRAWAEGFTWERTARTLLEVLREGVEEARS